MRRWTWMWMAVGLMGAGLACGDDDGGPPPPFLHGDFYDRLSGERAGYTYMDGQWYDDYGDAAFYGTAHHAWLAASTGDASAQQIADEATTYVRTVLADADILNGDANEIAMASHAAPA